mmetsp:Transcript_49382/g.104979  ORF Transcript_49382/g.104979 Transcript_49382/m.104979 type:complete len:238 (-) Transcript_49382:25-738(-)
MSEELDEAHFAMCVVDLLVLKKKYGERYRIVQNSDEELHNFTQGQLYDWALEMSAYRRDLDSGTLCPLTPSHIAILNQVGMPWVLQQNEVWDKNFNELESFHREHGHCDVPRTHQLGLWVMRQRQAYKHYCNDSNTQTPSDITAYQRVIKLNQLGFKWTVNNAWQDHFEKLLNSKQEKGHCNVPNRYDDDRKLGNWVKKQRQLKKDKDNGKSSSLTDEQKSQLDGVGFRWVVNKSRK